MRVQVLILILIIVAQFFFSPGCLVRVKKDASDKEGPPMYLFHIGIVDSNAVDRVSVGPDVGFTFGEGLPMIRNMTEDTVYLRIQDWRGRPYQEGWLDRDVEEAKRKHRMKEEKE